MQQTLIQDLILIRNSNCLNIFSLTLHLRRLYLEEIRAHATSVTRLGDFLKFLVTFLSKVAQMHGKFLGYSEMQHFSC